MDQEPAPQPQSRPILTSKPKRTVTLGACCIYELGPNEKPSQAMKRKNEEMQGELSNLRQLYDFLRLRPEHEAMEILKRIRSNSPDVPPSQRIQELADFVRHGDLLIQQPLQTPPGSNIDRDPLHSVTLPPLRQALDSPGSLESYSLLYPGIYPMGFDGPATQRRRHTQDLSARTDSQSSLPRPTSIEAILHTPSTAAADDLAADPRLRYVGDWTPVTDDTGFLAHLVTIWTEREYVYYHFLERDAFLADLSSNRHDFCSELLVNVLLASACFHSSAVKDRNKPFSENSIQTSFYYEARRLWDLEEGKDSLTKVQAGMIFYLVLAKYGRDRDGQRFLLEACISAQNLGLFDHESPQNKTTPTHISVDRWRRARAVTAWAVYNFQLSMAITYSFPVVIKNLPAAQIPYEDAEPIFRSDMQYNVNIVKLFRPVLDREASSGEDAAYIDRARSILSSSLREIRRLVLLHDTHHGWSNAITFVIHGITVASFGTLDEMAHNKPLVSQPAIDERYQGLVTCLRALTVLLSYSYYAQPVFRLLTQKCVALGVRLPAEVQGALDYCTSEEWTKKAAELVSSQYIADTRSVAKDTETMRMDAVISRWENLSLEDKQAWASRTGKEKAGL
ncbi:hypothetical protein E8E11_012008 [Didymella keratinophila]|nr:hypothetical protein E8E11_012008 [Didymella keratinophila]